MRRGQTDLHMLAGAYALDAVSDADRAQFEQHLARCEACAAEIRGLREATARLGASAAVRPREELKARALRAAAHTRQLPPVTAGGPAAGGRAGPRRVSWLPRLAAAGAAGFLAVAVAMGVFAAGTQHRLDQDQARGHSIAAVLNAPDVTMLTAQVTSDGTATVLESRHMRALVFTAAHLPALPTAKGYELWLMGPAGVRPAGMLPHPRAGMIGPMVVSGLAAGDRLGLSVEPADGSARRPAAPVAMLGPGS